MLVSNLLAGEFLNKFLRDFSTREQIAAQSGWQLVTQIKSNK